MIDPATCWFEIKETVTRSSNVVANIVKQMWLTRYPWPQKDILDRCTEFMKDFIMLIWDEYGIKCKSITTRNPQANSIEERAHQILVIFYIPLNQDLPNWIPKTHGAEY
eukprot:15344134-Ditylum_brightwellii.AAC.1